MTASGAHGDLCRLSFKDRSLPAMRAVFSAIAVRSPTRVVLRPATVHLNDRFAPLAEPDATPNGVNSKGRSKASLPGPLPVRD